MKKHLTIVVSGRVQGVYFRASTKSEADSLGLTGMVRNQSDGSVYIEAEGDEEVLQRFIGWCHRGPTRAQVTAVDVKEGPMKNYVGFDVQR